VATDITNSRILIVDDTLKNIQLLGTILKKEGYQLNVANNGIRALEMVDKLPPDLILLDIMMPELDGYETCKRLKASADTKHIPIIFLTAKSETEDVVKGFDIGAVDFITKPFSPKELIARVKNLLNLTAQINMGQSDRTDEGVVNLIVVDQEKMTAYYKQQLLPLTVVEFRLLSKLSEHPGRVFSRSQLMDSLYDDHRVVTERAIDSHIKNLRRKLNDIAPNSEVIVSVYGAGYKFDEDVLS
jgi:two-component system response regulator BaeR